MLNPDDLIARIERFNDSRGGGVVVDHRRGGYTLLLEATGAPIARLPIAWVSICCLMSWTGYGQERPDAVSRRLASEV